MAQIAPAELQKVITELSKRFEVGKLLTRVEIEPGVADDSEATLRIILRVKNLRRASLSDLQGFVTAVEDSLSERDDRYPSVRFAEAA